MTQLILQLKDFHRTVRLSSSMKFVAIVIAAFIICTSKVLGNACPRTNSKANTLCIDECQPSFGCSDFNKDCLCDGNCGYSCVKKSLRCPPLKKLRHGNIIGSTTTFNSTITFECLPKFTLFGPRSRRCTAKGRWDGKKSRCKISCADPGVPKNTNRMRKFSALGFKERTILRYECLPGYTTTDPLSIKCQNNGKWSSLPPACTVQQCGKAKLPANSQVRFPRRWKNKATHQLGKRIWLTCKPGYRSAVIWGRMTCERNGWNLTPSGYTCNGKSCGNPGTPRNGKKSGLSYAFNDVVYYSCDNCYKLTGVNYRQCLADGTWSNTLPSCTRLTCPTPDALKHGTLSLSSQPIYCGSFVEYKCSIGYNLKGSKKQTCLGDRTWSGDKPVCEIVDCGDPGHPQNGMTQVNDGYTYGNDITFTCNENYVLEGNLLATCQSNGKWSKSVPKCLEKCSDPSGRTNAQVIGKEFYHGKDIQFVCPKNSVLVPSRFKKLTCTNGEWRGMIPRCKASCPRLPSLPDGRVYGKSRTHGKIVQFGCNFGHQLVGSYRTSCDDGRWSQSMPKCLAKCNRIQKIGNGWVDGKSYLEGGVLSFRCRTDYILDGDRIIECTGHRRWNATKPACRAPCSKLGSPEHGKITQQGFRHNEEVQIECDRDYFLEGSNTLICSDGKWDSSLPVCFAPCKRFNVEPFRGGYIKRNGYRHNDQVLFGCRGNLVIDGHDTLQCNDGVWSNKLPTCGGPCKKFTAPRNGKILRNGYKHKETVTFGCRTGFQIVGTPHRICNFGVWSDSRPPRCEAKCLDPSTETNARVLGNEFYDKKEVQFVCSNDDRLDPEVSKKLTCEKGKWNGIIPWCKASCPPLLPIRNGAVDGGERRAHGSHANFLCNSGYQQIGSSTTHCNDGKWTDNPPKCLEKCSDPSNQTNAQVTGKDFYHGKEIQFVCPANSILVPSKSNKLICRNGKWRGKIPKCKASCPRLPSLPDGRVSGRSRTHGKIVQFRCNSGHQLVGSYRTSCDDAKCNRIQKIGNGWVDGKSYLEGDVLSFRCRTDYILDGDRIIECTGHRRWNATKPTCKAPCSKLGSPEHGKITRQGFRHNEEVQIECDHDYFLEGSNTLICSDGKWDSSLPVCFAQALSPTTITTTTPATRQDLTPATTASNTLTTSEVTTRRHGEHH